MEIFDSKKKFLIEKNTSLRLHKSTGVSDHIPYVGISNSILYCRDGSVSVVYELEGVSFETLDDDELVALHDLRSRLFRGDAACGVTFNSYLRRVRIPLDSVCGSSDSLTNGSFSSLVAGQWLGDFEENQLFLNKLFMAITVSPNEVGGVGFLEGLKQWWSGIRDPSYEVYDDGLSIDESTMQILKDTSSLFADHYKSASPKLLDDKELESFIDWLICFGDATFSSVQFGSSRGAVGRNYFKCVSIKRWPDRLPNGVLNGLLTLPCEYELCFTTSLVDSNLALKHIDSHKRAFLSSDSKAKSLVSELELLEDRVASGYESMVTGSLQFMLFSDSVESLEDSTRTVVQYLTRLGFQLSIETLALEACFWSRFPSNTSYIARSVYMTAANASALYSANGYPQGNRKGRWGEPLLMETIASTPYFFSLHRDGSDVGHTLILGPTGSGKSTLLAFLLTMYMNYNPRLFIFDKDRGLYLLTQALGGVYQKVSPDNTHSGFVFGFKYGTDSEISFLQKLAYLMSSASGYKHTLDDQDSVYSSLRFMRDDGNEEGIDAFLSYLDTNSDLYKSLLPWRSGNRNGWVFSSSSSSDFARVTAFDFSTVLDDEDVCEVVLFYFMERISQSMNGDPFIICIDEGWKALTSPFFSDAINDWIRTVRKKNGIVVFTTNSEEELDTPVGKVIKSQLANKIYLPGNYSVDLSAHEKLLLQRYRGQYVFLLKNETSNLLQFNLNSVGRYLPLLSSTTKNVELYDSMDFRSRSTDVMRVEKFLNTLQQLERSG